MENIIQEVDDKFYIEYLVNDILPKTTFSENQCKKVLRSKDLDKDLKSGTITEDDINETKSLINYYILEYEKLNKIDCEIIIKDITLYINDSGGIPIIDNKYYKTVRLRIIYKDKSQLNKLKTVNRRLWVEMKGAPTLKR